MVQDLLQAVKHRWRFASLADPGNPALPVLLILLLLLPALLIHLGLNVIIEDEGIRGLVAFEMGQRGDLLSPTLFGELYLKKPPLYNWIILAFFRLTNSYSEFSLRLPMILSLLVFAGLVYHFVKKEMGSLAGLFVSLMVITTGRILLYESLHGLIDLAFSCLIFLYFMQLYFLGKREKYGWMFLVSYLILALAFLMKGLPALVFGGITLLVWAALYRKWKILFRLSHFAGILLFLAVIAGYYLRYFLDNPVPPLRLFSVLFMESASRTPLYFGLGDVIRHILGFPAGLVFHFLPWTLFLVLMVRKGWIRKLREQPFVFYSALVFLANLVPYWLSPQVYPRYLLMLVPLMLTVLCWYFILETENPGIRLKVVYLLLGAGGAGLLAFILFPLFHPVMRGFPHAFLKSTLLFLAGIPAFVMFLRAGRYRILWFVLIFLLARISMNWFILPYRDLPGTAEMSRDEAREVGVETADKPLFSYWNPAFEEDDYAGKCLLQYKYMYYLYVSRGSMVWFRTDTGEPGLYMARRSHLEGGRPYRVLRQLYSPLSDDPVYLVQFDDPAPGKETGS